MRPRYWIKCACSFQLFSSVESSSLRHPRGFTHVSAQMSFLGEIFTIYKSVSVTSWILSFALFLFMAPITKSCLFIYELSPHTYMWAPWEPRPQRNKTARFVHGSVPTLGTVPGTEKALTKCALTARMRSLLKSFVKTSPLCFCIFYNESNKHFSILLFIFPPSLQSFFQNLLSDNHLLVTFSGIWEPNCEQNRHNRWFLGACSLVGGIAVNQALIPTWTMASDMKRKQE